MPDRGTLISRPIPLLRMFFLSALSAVLTGVWGLCLASGLADGSALPPKPALPAALSDQPGDIERGRRIVLDRERGDCVVCHAMPLPGRQFHGSLGLPLDGIGSRSGAAELRLRLVNPKAFDPHTIMPAYHSTQGLYRVLGPYRGRPILSAQEIENVVAYLLSLRADGPAPLPVSRPYRADSERTEAGSAAVVDGRRSGYVYLSEENRRLQDDAFGNPGLLWVERGSALWVQPHGPSHTSCASCHADPAVSMRDTRTRYPRFDPRRKGLINLEQQINRCREERLGATAYAYESEELLALTVLVGFQSRGLPLQVNIEGPAKPFFEAGRVFFERRRGQLDMACAQCHDEYAGQRLRGDILSQGQINGFPIYRHAWQSLGSSHRMFAWCNTAIRAEPLAYGADEYINLELYLAWRGRGLGVETPAVRR